MDWLKNHEFLAAWLNVPLTVILAALQMGRPDSKPLAIRRVVIYFAFLTCLAVLLSPLDAHTREAAGFAFYTLLFYILWLLPDDLR
jgi:hypothetical protein